MVFHAISFRAPAVTAGACRGSRLFSSETWECMKHTVLHPAHESLGAKLAPFGGFVMPIQYSGILAEHYAARNEAALFDTCHMGEFRIDGPHAVDDLQRLISSDVASVKIGRCRNGFFCNEQGGVIDDLIVYRLGEQEFMIVVNAATQESDFEWVTGRLSPDTHAENVSDSTAKIDLQGPRAPRILQELLGASVADFEFYTHRTVTCDAGTLFISRTGYTGEIGFEMYCALADASRVWERCLELGAVPAGLGARDTLRLEMCYPLYGHELNAQRNAGESGFSRLIASNKEFIGSGIVTDTSRYKDALVPLVLEGRRAARQGDTIRGTGGEPLGEVTSGSYSPSLERAIALGYVRKERAEIGTEVLIAGKRNSIKGTIARKPLYDRGTFREPIDRFL